MKTKEIEFTKVSYFVGNKQVSKQEAIDHVSKLTIHIRRIEDESYQALVARTSQKRKAKRITEVLQEERAPSEAYIS
jgi:hypothetical protein